MESKFTQTNISKRVSPFSWLQSILHFGKLPPRVVMFITFAGMSIINYGFGLAAGWLLAPEAFGLLAFVQTVLTIAGLVLNSGFTWSLTADIVGAAEADRARRVRGAFLSNLFLALVIGDLLCVLYSLGPLKPGFETWPVVVFVVVTLPLFSLVAVARATIQGSERFGALAVIWLVEAGTKAAAGIGLVHAGYGAIGAVAGFLIGSLVAALFGLFYLIFILKVHLFGEIERPSFHRIGAMFAAILGMGLLLNLDLIALKLLSHADRAAVGRYQAGTILANTPYYLLTAMIPVIFTQIARMRKLSRSAVIVGETFQFALIFLLPMEIALAVFPGMFMGLLFPSSYLAGAAALRVLAMGNASIILAAILSAAFQATGNAHFPARTILTVIVFEVIGLKIVVPAWQSPGAASMFFMAASISALVLGRFYLRELTKTSRQKALAWFRRYLISIAVGLLTGYLAFVFGNNGWLAITAGGVVYLAAVFWFRLFPLSSLFGQAALLRIPVIKEE